VAKLTLASALDPGAASDLYSRLKTLMHEPVELDGSEVEWLGTPALQVLIGAKTRWDQAGLAFEVVRPSAAFSTALARMDAADLASTGDME